MSLDRDRPAIVVGAGIGGLTAAIALRRAGLAVEVYERAPELVEVGAGLTVQPNAVIALRAVGLDRAVLEAGCPLPGGRLLRWDGRVLASFPAEDVYREVGAPAVGIHRGTLQRLLLEALGPGVVRTGQTALRYDPGPDGVALHLTSGHRVPGALLIGADGLHSAVRAQLLGDGPPAYAGYTAWRGVAMESAATRVDTSSETWGRGRRFGMVPIDGGRVYWFATLNTAVGGQGSSRRDLLELFRGWHAPVESLIEATPEEKILRNDVFDRRPSARWGAERVTLLGDAAHPMTPNLGQGACQAIEDAVVLAQCLGASPEPAAGLRRYEEARRARANRVVTTARRLGVVGQWENRLGCWMRDAAFAALPPGLTRRQLAEAWSFKPPPPPV